ncbi:MAG TPA: hypothetical protein VFU76_04205 [Terriglobales bacterium]|nr:hypothetical protein [Terriglobales bacterium]
MHGRIRSWLVVAVLAGLLPAAAQTTPPAGKAKQPIRGKASAAALWVNFVPVPKGAPVRSIAGQGTLDLGRISYTAGSTQDGVTITQGPRTFTVRTRFGLQVGSPDNVGTAKLLGVLNGINPAIRVTVDGVRLTPSPEVIQMALKFGAVSEHRLEIEVPVTMYEAAAQVVNAISFQVIAN